MRIALELRPVGPPDAGSSCDQLLAAAAAAERSGVEALWVAGEGADPVTLAGAVATVTSVVTVGVIAGLGATERNPSVLARDLTALDVLSRGRAALLLEAAAPMVYEAAEVCHLLFAGGETDFEGQWFTLAGAVNRPSPVQSPAVLIQAPQLPDHARADGWVTTAGVEDVGEWRRQAQDAPLWWRGSLGDDPAMMASALGQRGVDGLIARVSATKSQVEKLADLLT